MRKLLLTAATFLTVQSEALPAQVTHLIDDTSHITATSEWNLSAVEAQKQIDDEIIASLAVLICSVDSNNLSSRLRTHIHTILRDPSVKRTLHRETRQRAYGKQFRLSQEVAIPSSLIDAYRRSCQQIATEHKLFRAAIVLAGPVLFAVYTASFVALDRVTYGDRRMALAIAWILVSLMTAFGIRTLLQLL